MSKVYVTGHKNPDLDTICSAYAYAALKNILNPENEYEAVRCGHLSESCKKILKAMKIKVPPYMPDVYPKVSDVCLTSTNKFDINDPMTKVAKAYKDTNPSVMPVFEGKEFVGLLSVDDITAWYMKELQGESIDTNVPKIGNLMREQEEPLQATDLFEEAKISLSTSVKRGLAVFDGEKYIGFVTRRCFLKAPRYNVILMDHNEPKQSIKGIETANIIEIIDHHRLDALKTNLPIFIDAEPVGSTCTIVYELYVRNKLEPTEDVARALLTGMMADTLILKSPTTTAVDEMAAGALAKICNVDINEFGTEMFSHMESLSTVNPEKAVLSDFKRYTEKGTNIGIGQCEATTLNDLENYKDKFIEALEDVRTKNGLDWAVVMITDVMKENSVLITTDYRAVKYLPFQKLEEKVLDMPGVMSRKKQLLPEMIYALGM